MLHKVWPGENTKTSKLLSFILYALSCTCKGKFGKIKKKRREPQEKSEMKRQGIGSSQAKHYIDKLDRYRESYYKYHTGRQWKRVENYDLCLDSAAIGLDNCVELIKKVI